MSIDFVAYFSSVLLLVIIPGPDMLLLVRALSSNGWMSAVNVSTGVVLGCLCWGVVVLTGVDFLTTADGTFFLTTKIFGSLCLLYLGYSCLRGGGERVKAKPNHSGWFFSGFISNLLNPKVGFFYLTILPLFIGEDDEIIKNMSILIAVHIITFIVWSCILIILSSRMISFLVKNKSAIDKFSACFFLGLALNVIFFDILPSV